MAITHDLQLHGAAIGQGCGLETKLDDAAGEDLPAGGTHGVAASENWVNPDTVTVPSPFHE